MLIISLLQTVQTALETSGEPSVLPYATNSPTIAATISVAPAMINALVVQPSTAPKAVNIFDAPIAVGPPPAVIGSRAEHPVPRLNVIFSVTFPSAAFLTVFQINQNSPIATNKFYAAFFLGTQSNAVWTHPYSLAWSKGTGNAKSWGLSVSYIEPDQKVGNLLLQAGYESAGLDHFVPTRFMCELNFAHTS